MLFPIRVWPHMTQRMNSNHHATGLFTVSIIWSKLCVLWNDKTRKSFFPSELCQGTYHFNIKQNDKAEKVIMWSLLDGEGWKRSYSRVPPGWSCTGGLSSIPQFRVHSLFSYNFILSLFIHMMCQFPALAHSWSIGQSCQSFGFSWGTGWG